MTVLKNRGALHMLEKSRPRLQDQKKYQRRKDKRRRKKLQFIRLHTMLEGAHMLQEGGQVPKAGEPG